jgi:PAS domain S-box-containing protein
MREDPPDPALAEGMWSWDAATEQVHFNERFAQLAGAGSVEEGAARLREAIRTLPQGERLELAAAVTCGQEFELDVAVRQRDERFRTLRIRGRGQLDRHGVFIGAAGTARDLGEFEDITDAEERYRFIVGASTHEAVWDWDLDSGDVYWNDRLLELVGLTRREFDALEGAHVLFHPDDVEAMNDAKERHYRGETPLYEVEHRMLHKSGQYRRVLTRGRAHLDARGRPRRMVGLVYDLTAAQEQLESEELARFALEATGSGTWKYDYGLGRLHFSDQLRELLGYDRFLQPDLDWLERRLSPEDLRQARALLAEGPPERFQLEVTFTDSDGRARRLLCQVRSHYGASGALERLGGVVQDVSELHALRQEREALLHDLRDSVGQELAASAIYVAAQALCSERPSQEQSKLLAILRRAQREMSFLMASLRQPSPCGAPPLPELLEPLLAGFWWTTGIPVALDSDPVQLDHATAQAAHFIVGEALDNARRHAQAHTVSVRARRDGRWVIILIEDDGRGFQPTQPRPEEGGLQAMSDRAREVGGAVELDSAPGKGTRVRLTLAVVAGAQ